MARVHNRCSRLILCAGWALAMIGLGCSGKYEIAAADQLAPAGQQAQAVARIRHQEFWLLHRSVKEMPLRFYVDDQPQRAAITDRKGYAAANVPVPAEPGVYPMVIAYQDLFGQEAWTQVPTHVWPADAQVTMVDLDGLKLADASGQVAGLSALAQSSKLIYLSTDSPRDYAQWHVKLESVGAPDGPIVPWNKGKPAQVAAQLESLRGIYPNARTGVGDVKSAALFEQAGLQAQTLDWLAQQAPPATQPPQQAEPASDSQAPAEPPPADQALPPADAPAVEPATQP